MEANIATSPCVRQAVFRAISEALGIPEISLSEDQRLVADLGADSMSLITIMLLLEDSLDVEVNLAELPNADATIAWVIEQLSRTNVR